MRLSRFDLVGQIHVAAQRDVHAVERDGWLSNGFLETRSQLAAPCVGALGLLDLGRGWIEQYGSARAIENDFRAGRNACHRAAQTEDRRYAERVRENRSV